MQAQISHIETSYSQRGAVSYRAEVSHGGLNKHRTIRGSNSDEVKRKAQLQAHSWNEAWAKKQAQEARRQAIDRNKQIAMERTGEAEKSLHELEHLLNHGLQTESLIDWESLKDATLFGEPHPNNPRVPKYRLEPQRNDPKFAAHSGLLDNIFKSRKARKEAEAQQMYEVAHSKWTADCAEVDKAVETAERQFAEAVKDWGNRRDSYIAAQSEKNAAIDRRRELCESRDQNRLRSTSAPSFRNQNIQTGCPGYSKCTTTLTMRSSLFRTRFLRSMLYLDFDRSHTFKAVTSSLRREFRTHRLESYTTR